MNNAYYPNLTFPGQGIGSSTPNTVPNQQTVPSLEQNINNMNMNLFEEQSYIENILRLNKGKLATLYVTIPDSNEWRDRKFTGIIEQAGRDHIIVSNPSNGEWYLILMIYLDYVTFEEVINYSPDFSLNTSQ